MYTLIRIGKIKCFIFYLVTFGQQFFVCLYNIFFFFEIKETLFQEQVRALIDKKSRKMNLNLFQSENINKDYSSN